MRNRVGSFGKHQLLHGDGCALVWKCLWRLCARELTVLCFSWEECVAAAQEIKSEDIVSVVGTRLNIDASRPNCVREEIAGKSVFCKNSAAIHSVEVVDGNNDFKLLQNHLRMKLMFFLLILFRVLTTCPLRTRDWCRGVFEGPRPWLVNLGHFARKLGTISLVGNLASSGTFKTRRGKVIDRIEL